MLEAVLGRPGAGVDLKQHLLEALASQRDSGAHLRAGFAYVTRTGVDELLAALNASPQWSDTTKQWLVGVHHAISEPVAINTLGALPKSQVRLAVCGENLQNAIIGRTIFHAKIAAVSWKGPYRITSLLAGSANLTGAATGPRARNYEAGLAWRAHLPTAQAQKFASWWNTAWSEALPATHANLDAYVAMRDRFLLKNPDVILGTTVPSPSELSRARMLWIEAGDMSGGSRNQVEFSEELAVFFGPVMPTQRLITIISGSQRWDERPLSPKRTTLGVRIWRLSLPTFTQSGLEYPRRTICITKADSGREYQLEVADSDSEAARRWRELTHRSGVVARTGGGRSYGFM